MKVLVTGSKGFIAGYLIEELLGSGYEVIGIDNLSKYGDIEKSYDNNKRYQFVKGDVKDTELMKQLIADCDQAVFIAAMVGGITYFHKYAYDLLAENERICASSFDAAIWAQKNGGKLKRISILSSSMVYEMTNVYPTKEGEQLLCAPPRSSYGFQKLGCEYFAKAAYDQHGLPYTILRPFNCIGVGERKALGENNMVKSGNVEMAMSHVVPDLIKKILVGQYPLHILGKGNQVRHYTYGGDLARGIRLAMESDKSLNNDFNLSIDQSTTVLELAKVIWDKIFPKKEFAWVSDEAYEHDVQMRIPDVTKAKEILGFEAKTTLSEALDEIIPWIADQLKKGNL